LIGTCSVEYPSGMEADFARARRRQAYSPLTANPQC
jgi:hypothetical protein